MPEQASQPEVFDLAGLDPMVKAEEEGVVCELKHPVSHKPLGQSVTVCGPDSSRARAAERWRLDRQVGRMNGTVTDGSDIEDAVEHVARLCVGWDVFVDGARPPFSLEAAKAFFIRFPFFFDQVNLFGGRRRNFTSA